MNLDRELMLIRNTEIRDFTKNVIDYAPEYFWTAAASSTGKYHPSDSLGEGGLIRHTKKVVYLCQALIRQFEVEKYNDEIISGAILHDIIKFGKDYENGKPKDYDEYKNHGIVAVNLIKKMIEDDLFVPLEDEKIEKIYGIIESHMSAWVGPKERKPDSKSQWVVAIADMMSAQKMVVFPDKWYEE